jgi:hypothetical protein
MTLSDSCFAGTVEGEQQVGVSYVLLSDWSLGGDFFPVLAEE